MKKILLAIYDLFMDYISSVDFDRIVDILRFASFGVSCVLIGFIFYILVRIRKDIKERIQAGLADIVSNPATPKVVDEQWQSVLKKVDGDDSDLYKLAVLEGDKIFDDLLKRMKLAGDDMGERLKQLRPEQVPNIDDLWRAHKLRNRIAHEPDFKPSRAEAKMAVETYRIAMEKLGAV